MGSLSHRTILQYIELNDLPGLKTYLDARRHTAVIDDRDEVLNWSFKELKFDIIFDFYLEWCHRSYCRC